MERKVTKESILDVLYNDTFPTRRRYNMELDEYLEILNEMVNEGTIGYSLVGDHPTHKGEVKHIWLTDKGKEYVRNKNKDNTTEPK